MEKEISFKCDRCGKRWKEPASKVNIKVSFFAVNRSYCDACVRTQKNISQVKKWKK